MKSVRSCPQGNYSVLRTLRDRIAVAALVLAVLLTQSIGLWHGIVHAGHGADSAHVSSLATGATAPDPVNGVVEVIEAPDTHHFFETLVGDHDGRQCQLFDQLCHGDALATLSVVALPLGVPAAHIAHLTGLAVARWAALFQARAPPVSR